MVAVEAGTGTGKTVAYSLAAIPTAKAAGKRLVIATATVALQEQNRATRICPDLMRNSGLNFSFALAKGRGRYLCLSKLDHAAARKATRKPPRRSCSRKKASRSRSMRPARSCSPA